MSNIIYENVTTLDDIIIMITRMINYKQFTKVTFLHRNRNEFTKLSVTNLLITITFYNLGIISLIRKI